MADKVQKIREEVVRLHNLLPVMDGDNISVNYADRICTALKMYIDSLQEEPVSEDLNTAAKEYANNITKKIGYRLQLRRAVCFGAKWKEEKLMKNAVECEYFDGSLFRNDLREKYRDGDKVKTVIVKSE